MFVCFGLIFKSVYEDYLNTVIRQNGNNIGSMVEGALYYSMLENDKRALQSTLDMINTMSGIDEVNMYDNLDSLVYSSYNYGTTALSNPNCKECHPDISELFPFKEKSYRIIDEKSACTMNESKDGHRQLLIRSPIYNEKSCYLSSCHAHPESDVILGSFIIKVPLQDLDMAVIYLHSSISAIRSLLGSLHRLLYALRACQEAIRPPRLAS